MDDVQLHYLEGVVSVEEIAGEKGNHFISDLLVDQEKRRRFAVCGYPFGKIARDQRQWGVTVIADHIFVHLEA